MGLAIAVYAIARHLPLFLFGPVAGVVVDRVSRRRVMIAADLLRAALALGFLLADRAHSLAVIYAVGASLFSVSAFFNAAKRASVPNLVARHGRAAGGQLALGLDDGRHHRRRLRARRHRRHPRSAATPSSSSTRSPSSPPPR